MYSEAKAKFVIGEELSLEEIENFATLGKSNRIKNLSRNEELLLRYCYAIENGIFYMSSLDNRHLMGSEKYQDHLGPMTEMFMFLLNNESLKLLDSNYNVKFVESESMKIGGYYQDIIEFSLLQAGRKVVCDDYWSDNLNAYRFDTDKTYKTEECEPVSVRELADSILAKIKAAEEESEME